MLTNDFSDSTLILDWILIKRKRKLTRYEPTKKYELIRILVSHVETALVSATWSISLMSNFACQLLIQNYESNPWVVFSSLSLFMILKRRGSTEETSTYMLSDKLLNSGWYDQQSKDLKGFHPQFTLYSDPNTKGNEKAFRALSHSGPSEGHGSLSDWLVSRLYPDSGCCPDGFCEYSMEILSCLCLC